MPKESGGSSKPVAVRESAESTKPSTPAYVDVAVPLHVSNAFTYRLPEHLRDFAQVGSRVIVPLGKRLTTGYIVSLYETLPADSSLGAGELKFVDQVLDTTPLVTPEILQTTQWVSEYYGSPWGEVIKAALPPGITADIEQFLKITPKGRSHLTETPPKQISSLGHQVIQMIADADQIRNAEVVKALGTQPAAKAVRELEKEGFIEAYQRSRGSSAKGKEHRVVRLLRTIEELDSLEGKKLTEAQQRILGILAKSDMVPLRELLATAKVSVSAVNTLQKRGVVEVSLAPVRRDPLAGAALPQVKEYDLTEAQRSALVEIEKPLSEGVYSSFLLHGVTGSGKTEVYMRAMRICLQQGRSAMMLVPEIALTPVFSRRLRAHFGDQVAIFHSSLSKGERFDEWMRVKDGLARIVIGTRSAVFAPIARLGLVVVDEEHESTYRQQDSPHYNGRDTAIVRAQKESAVVVLGSATPSLESFHNTQTSRSHYLRLPGRIGDRPMASARIIDMREVFDRYKKPRVFSDELLEAIAKTQQRKEQSIILLNRRGYSSFVLCRSCGETVQCPNCDVTLTYHRSMKVLLCHYCNHRQGAPNLCPNCDGKYIYYVGEGTEQIEAMLTKLFPALAIARIDRDTASRRGHFEKALLAFSEGAVDMLVGTQMLAKGHDFPNVTLVGVVSVDAGLALPDFRAAERTFQLITQVAGRAGRGDRGGQVLIQTYHPKHYALRHACAQDYAGFYKEEIRHRENHAYPPFVSLASLLIHGTDLGRVRSESLTLRKELDVANKERVCRILGPAPAPLARLKGDYRIQLLVKSRNRRQLREVVDRALAAVSSHGINLRSINLEIDPISIM